MNVLGITAPIDDKAAKLSYPLPYPSYPNVPDAMITGLFNSIRSLINDTEVSTIVLLALVRCSGPVVY